MTERYIVLPRTKIGKFVWDSFVQNCDEAWLWHRYAFSESIAHWTKCEDISFALIDSESQNQIVALLPLRKINRRFLNLFPVHVFESMGGPAIANQTEGKPKRQIIKVLRNELKRLSYEGLCLESRIFTSPMAPAFRGERCPCVNPLLDFGFENTLSQTWVVDLRLGDDAVWSRLDGRARTAVRKAEKAGVIVRMATQDDLDVYYKLHVETYSRSGIKPHPVAYFQSIWTDFLSQELACVWLAEFNGEVVAAENFAIFKQAAVYWTGASTRSGLDLGANSLLQWSAIKWMIAQGLTWYETGEAFPHALSGKQKGLNDFKKSFGGKLHPFYKARLFNGTWSEKLYRVWNELGREANTND